jgi:omega-6 fatty acid desaturase (delta-12 desaturase)
MTSAGTPASPVEAEALSKAAAERLARHCMAYRDANDGRALVQLAVTLVPFAALVAAMMWAAAAGHAWHALLLALPAGGLLVRIFTIQHDCGHGSFMTGRRANAWLGRALSLLTFTPYEFWRRAHTLHHATAGDLSRRGIGDVDTLTVREYRALPGLERLKYRIYRNPLVLHVIGPPLYFVLLQRSPFGQALPARQIWRSVLGLNLGLVGLYGTLAALVGLGPVGLTFLAVACVASWVGAWLFFVQHQFEHTRWDEAAAWDFQLHALEGSSYYVLPRVLQWFTGNVGLHHIHHLNSRIPNYRLQECLDDEPLLGSISRLTVRESLRCIGLALWDEEARRLVSFAQAARSERALSPA